ncbi:hypothetical protein C1H46_001212 [Malus baccata]|uniref:Uncharacterized protein n=1 Tax=Malus baccata TaxID=106549 RepID=A0A540NQ09_MALBA|nr:hypothetical protein C1H46_001212 [Malus baccata]
MNELVSSPIEVRIDVFVHDSELGTRRKGENASKEEIVGSREKGDVRGKSEQRVADEERGREREQKGE